MKPTVARALFARARFVDPGGHLWEIASSRSAERWSIAGV